jgi:DNA topoisomerase III
VKNPQASPKRLDREHGRRALHGQAGPCPVCGSEVLDQAKTCRCNGWQSGCKFVIWKAIAGKRIGMLTAQALLKQGRSRVLKGFASKSGKPFEARLRLEGGEVRFDFDS